MSAPPAETCPVYEKNARTAYSADKCRCEVCAEQRREDSRRWYRNGAKEQQERWKEENEERVKENRKRQYWEDPETAREAALEWYYENREQALENVRQYREENPEKARAVVRRWFEENPERVREHRRRRKARVRGASGEATSEQVMARIEYYGERCYLCGDEYEAIDHVIPIARGGTDWPANLRPICTSCNSKKGAKPLSEVA